MRDDLHGWTPRPFITECNTDIISSIFDLVLTLILLHFSVHPSVTSVCLSIHSHQQLN